MAAEKTITVFGRLSFPILTAQEAYDRSQTGQYKYSSVAEAKPSVNLVLAQDQWDKFRDHLTQVYLPWIADREKAGEAKDALPAKDVKVLIDGLMDLENQMYNSPAKAVSEKTLALAPEAVASVKGLGTAGVDLKVMAYAADETDLVMPDAGDIKFPALYPIERTRHQLYAGAYCGMTCNLYSYRAGKFPGIGAGISAVVFRADAEPFSGGVTVDESAFLD